MLLTEQYDQVVHISDERVQGLQGYIFDNVFVVARGFVLDEPLEHILFTGEFT